MKLLDDEYLKPYEAAIKGRSARAKARAIELSHDKSLADWASAHEYYGLHRVGDRWLFREWAPNATSMWLVGDFSGWKIDPRFECLRRENSDVWEATIDKNLIKNGDNYRLEIRWDGGSGERIPAYARYVVQDKTTNLFSAQVFESTYRWQNHFDATKCAPIPRIYEAHVGMCGEAERVHTYCEFRDELLPRIKEAGYDTVQLMAIMEHPYYGSFGYHVSSFFAASSRFGTPDELKSLIDTAHGMGLRVIMDLVHSHAVKNERDGLSRFDGTDYQYFHSGARGYHNAWDSRCFDYGKIDVLHFLLSNCRFWLDEYHFDGYRFDGVTSMLFFDHGLGDSFTDYSMYFNGSTDDDAWVYLNLANRVIHEIRPDAITIAEDVSGMPGVAAKTDDFGIGFDYRMAMGEPDYWFRLAEKVRDEAWSMNAMFHELTNKRPEEKVVSYVESHDQALVGGKTFFFQLADAAIYWGMATSQHLIEIERAIALHKLARLATFMLNGGAYLNFMGNEFGHPEWVDFPREENQWSYHHARRQWSLRDDQNLRFRYLAEFDKAMLAAFTNAHAIFARNALETRATKLVANDDDQVLAVLRGDIITVFNFSPYNSYTDYGIIVPPASDWKLMLDTDEPRFGGHGRIMPNQVFAPTLVLANGELIQQIKIYIPARSAVVLRRQI